MQEQIKLIHITTIDEGGAYKAVERIQQSLRQEGFVSNILVRTRIDESSDVVVYLDNIFKSTVSRTKNLLNLFLTKGEIARDVFGSDIVDHQLVVDADVIILHWINSFLSMSSIERILKLGKPVIWVMHDTWLFTGGCHVNSDCEKYQSGCGECPLIGTYKKEDISYLNYRDKEKLFEKYSFTVTGPSNWIVDAARKSKILSGKEIMYLPNCYNDNVFYKREDKRALRKKFIIDTKKHIILFGAAFNGTANANKGFSYLLEALNYLSADDYYLLIFGNADEKICKNLKQEHKLLGYISEEQILAEVYNIADVYVSPSLQESFGLTVCEAMACGIPVVAFPIGGINDQIVHKENGYLAELKNAKDIACGIEYCVDKGELLGNAARQWARRYTSKRVGKQFADLIQKILEHI